MKSEIYQGGNVNCKHCNKEINAFSIFNHERKCEFKCKLCKKPVNKEEYDLLCGYHAACENKLSDCLDKGDNEE